MKEYLQKLFSGNMLTQAEAEEAFNLMMRGAAGAEAIAGFLGALAARGESVAEIVGGALSLRRHALPFKTDRHDLIDVCGTGGDGAETFNISTTNALILAAGGLAVVKHGNRAVSSQSGSADVLEELGLRIDLSAERAAASLDQHGFTFLFAPSFHPAMKHVAPVRRALGVRTIFNLLGPLANPSGVKRQVIGVFAEKWLLPVAEALLALGTEEALVVWGTDGLDELSLSAPTRAIHLRGGKLIHLSLKPEDFGLSLAPLASLVGGDKKANARITLAILNGEKGPRRDIVVMNAAAAFVVAGRAADWRAGAAMACEAIDSGKARRLIEELRIFT